MTQKNVKNFLYDFRRVSDIGNRVGSIVKLNFKETFIQHDKHGDQFCNIVFEDKDPNITYARIVIRAFYNPNADELTMYCDFISSFGKYPYRIPDLSHAIQNHINEKMVVFRGMRTFDIYSITYQILKMFKL